jgi:Holliday junction DNA helicase RuvB
LRSADILGIGLDGAAARTIAERARGTPRIANRFLRRVRDLAQVRGETRVGGALAREALAALGVDDNGLEALDRQILSVLVASGGQPVGIKTIAAAVGESEDTIEDVYEPHLLRQGFVHKTGRGRVVTRAGCGAIGVDPTTVSSEPGLFS